MPSNSANMQPTDLTMTEWLETKTKVMILGWEPDVHGGGVRLAEDDLRRAVPASHLQTDDRLSSGHDHRLLPSDNLTTCLVRVLWRGTLAKEPFSLSFSEVPSVEMVRLNDEVEELEEMVPRVAGPGTGGRGTPVRCSLVGGAGMDSRAEAAGMPNPSSLTSPVSASLEPPSPVLSPSACPSPSLLPSK